MTNNGTITDAINISKRFKGAKVDIDSRTIILPCSKGITEEELLWDGMLGKYFMDCGFNVSFETMDIEYTTKGKWINYTGCVFEKGHTAWLRNRLCMILKW